jgi:RNA polymerase sigma-70 factor (ECF subfamily)
MPQIRSATFMDEPDTATGLDQLIERSSQGDRRAFRELYDLTSPRVFAVVRRMVGRADVAEDILQDVYLAIWRKAAVSYRSGETTGLAWLLTVARHRAIDRLRDHKRQSKLIGALDVDTQTLIASTSTESWQERDAESERLARGLAGIPEQQRNALLLAYYYGLTHEELSERLNVPLGTAKSWVRRGLRAMQEQLES